MPYFCGLIMTIFVSELQDVTPRIAAHIFDVFLVDGQGVIFTLLIKFIQLKEQTILEFDDIDDLQDYMRKELPKDCLKEYPMHLLLDFEAQVDVANQSKLKFH